MDKIKIASVPTDLLNIARDPEDCDACIAAHEMWPTWPHGACPYHHGINEAWATLDPQQLIDQLAAHIRQLHLEYDQARDRGSTHGMELAGKEIQGMQIALGRTLAWRDGLPEEHPTSAFNRGRDYMRAWAPA